SGSFLVAVADEIGVHVVAVFDAVLSVVLVAYQALGDHPHRRVLVANVAGGGVGAGLLRVLDAVGAQELVAAAQGDVAGDVEDAAGHADGLVALDVGGQAVAVGDVADRGLGVREQRNRVLQ